VRTEEAPTGRRGERTRGDAGPQQEEKALAPRPHLLGCLGLLGDGAVENLGLVRAIVHDGISLAFGCTITNLIKKRNIFFSMCQQERKYFFS
jgi:hypothetical protein